ncbi:acyltransferase [Aquincola sp. J276]|uniref:acyltransferase family protein n=1 Tax=Aquincola sp. J276 TaxID=2898432 RepID=UPI0021511152|nr:acyltransferase [Aquincola sp. J276]MCR5868801.1 acyltransferase [Aquincola sp. J276]
MAVAGGSLDPDTSVFLDLLRLVSALFVVLSHFTWPRISGGALVYFPGHAAVMVFFVLSGYVIAYAASQRERGARDYALNRLARLWSVVIPALLLTWLCDTVGRRLDPSLYPSAATWPTAWQLLSALVFVGQLWKLDITPMSNEPFWSLPYEFWYYVLLGCLLHLRGRARWCAVAGTAIVCGPKILLYLPIWWLGVWMYRRGPLLLSPAMARAVFAGCLVLLPLFFLLGYRTRWSSPWLPVGFSPFDYPLALCVAGLIGSFPGCAVRLGRLRSVVVAAASCTFTLYLCHLPIMLLLAAALPHDWPAPIRLVLLLCLTLMACWALAQITERKKSRVRAWLDRLLSGVQRALMVFVPTPAGGGRSQS